MGAMPPLMLVPRSGGSRRRRLRGGGSVARRQRRGREEGGEEERRRRGEMRMAADSSQEPARYLGHQVGHEHMRAGHRTAVLHAADALRGGCREGSGWVEARRGNFRRGAGQRVPCFECGPDHKR